MVYWVYHKNMILIPFGQMFAFCYDTIVTKVHFINYWRSCVPSWRHRASTSCSHLNLVLARCFNLILPRISWIPYPLLKCIISNMAFSTLPRSILWIPFCTRCSMWPSQLHLCFFHFYLVENHSHCIVHQLYQDYDNYFRIIQTNC